MFLQRNIDLCRSAAFGPDSCGFYRRFCEEGPGATGGGVADGPAKWL